MNFKLLTPFFDYSLISYLAIRVPSACITLLLITQLALLVKFNIIGQRVHLTLITRCVSLISKKNDIFVKAKTLRCDSLKEIELIRNYPTNFLATCPRYMYARQGMNPNEQPPTVASSLRFRCFFLPSRFRAGRLAFAFHSGQPAFRCIRFHVDARVHVCPVVRAVNKTRSA